MPLIRIEVCDFKSYRGHQTIGPFQHFTSVIGPNGAGKSNLMDAISFVLGVKSAQLRSSQLRDLVYRGRRLASEPPSMQSEDVEEEGEGTAKRAWVLAVYQDSKKQEWLFQRTISISGASEYKLNGRVVTYAAYNAALVSHNILVKAKNFLVFQGDVEAVASQSPKDLTRLIEQISGSLELAADYEKARASQESAAEQATHNFNKRRGITSEIKQYREQKAEADKFEDLVEKRDEAVLQRVLWKLWHIEQGIERNAHEIRTQGRALGDLRAERDAKDAELASARAEQAKARSTVIQKEKRIKKAEAELDKKRPDLVEAETRIAHSTRKQDKMKETLRVIEGDAGRQMGKLQTLEKSLSDVQKEADIAQEAQRAASQSNLSLSPQSLEEYRRLKQQASGLAVDERQSLEKLSREEKTFARSLVVLEDKHSELTQRRSVLEEDERNQNDTNNEIKTRLRDLQQQLQESKQALENQQSQRASAVQLEKELNEKLQDTYSKLLQAGADQRETERERRLKETLANLQRIFPGVRGRVVDLCKPIQRKYETAVATVLGRNIDAVVVDDERTAIECIDYMRNQRVGQAAFLPLDSIQVKPVNDKFRSFAKGARLAIDLVQYDETVGRAIQHACGSALICDTVDVARYVCYEKGQEVKAVTLDGTVIHKSGLITGGRSTHDNSKKWNEKDVQGLMRYRDSLLDQLKEATAKKPRGRDDELIAEINRLESSLQACRDDGKAAELRAKGLKEELKHVRKELREIEPKLREARKQRDELVERISKLADAISEAEVDVFAEFCASIGVSNIRDYEERQLKAATLESEARVRFETQIARLTHQVNFQREQLQETEKRQENLRQLIQAEEQNLEVLQDKKTEVEDAIRELEARLEEEKKELDKLNNAQGERTSEVDAAKRTASKAVKALDAALKEISSKNDEIEKLGVERLSLYRKCRVENIPLPLSRGSLRNVPIDETLNKQVAMDLDEDDEATQRPKQPDDFGVEVDFNSLDDNEREDGSADMGARFDDTIANLGAEIEKMAPNMKAVERLEDVERKLEETEQEASRTRQASKNARDEFEDIKRRRTELFNSAYNHISQTIDKVYKELTKGKAAPMGGVAYLSLEDSEEPYLAGIKYHAMPPMKRFRDMEQLSGGEKTVAALALLFAIHSYQPSPFFVLDEVDAALDNTNVAKIANYIRSHASDGFQFIVISLKGSLYERGHSLVGIYRDQDVNSSRTLTLDLTQYDE